MSIRWDYFVNQYETARYVSASDARDNRHIQFVREFASLVSVLQVGVMLFKYRCLAQARSGQDQQRHRSIPGHQSGSGGSQYLHLLVRNLHRASQQDPNRRTSRFLAIIHIADVREQIDRLNLEGYANLEHWVAELDKRIEDILLQRLTHIIQVWCTEFDRTDDGDTRRDPTNPRDMTSKRRGEKRKDEKVRRFYLHA